MAGFRFTWLRRGSGSDAPPPLLVDENLPQALARSLRSGGLQVEMVKDHMRGRADSEIRTAARRTRACILSRDADFVERALRGPTGVGVVHFQFSVRPKMVAALAPELVAHAKELRGSVLRVEPDPDSI